MHLRRSGAAIHDDPGKPYSEHMCLADYYQFFVEV